MQSWRNRRRIATTVEYVAEGTITYMQGVMGDGYPKEDYTANKKAKWLLHFKKNWARVDNWEPIFYVMPGHYRFYPQYTAKLWDGKQMQNYRPREQNISSIHVSGKDPDLSIQTKEYRGVVLSYFDQPVLFAHGIVPTRTKEATPQLLEIPMGVADFYVHERLLYRNIPCVIVRTRARLNKFNEFWVDPSREGAILRYKYFVRGEVSALIDIHYQKLHGHWLPRSWIHSFFGFGNTKKLESVEEVTVTNVTINPKVEKSDFHITPKSGMVVAKVKSQDYFRVNAAGELEPWTRSQTGWPGWLFYVLPLGVIGIVAVLFFYLRTRKRKEA